MFRRLLARRPRAIVGDAAVPQGVRVYAVGDIHGRADLLRALHERIRDDLRYAAPGMRAVAVYLGDYVDRGLHSRDVIDLLLDQPLPGVDAVHLRGNHDEEFLAFLQGSRHGGGWLRIGGDATLYSYGVRIPVEAAADERDEALRDMLRVAVPSRHVAFLTQLSLAYEIGDYFFAHAGIHPDRPLDRQSAEDLLWIRDAFLEADEAFEKVVVHGHSVSQTPEVRDNRIGIDTGACYTNVLTALVLEGRDQRFLSTLD